MSMPEHWCDTYPRCHAGWTIATVRGYAEAYARKHAERVAAELTDLRVASMRQCKSHREELAALRTDAKDLAAMVARLARAVKRLEPGNTLHVAAIDYLKRKGHLDPLRASDLNDPDGLDQDIEDTLRELENVTVKSVQLENKLTALRAAARAYMSAECGEGSISRTLDALDALLTEE
jgi:hypothetical protein